MSSAREFFEQLEAGEKPSLMESIKEIAGQIWDAATPAFELGAEEISRFLNTGNGFVYHGDTIPEQTPVEPMHKGGQEQDRGMEM